MTYPRQKPRHAEKTRTRDDYRRELALYLTYARSLEGITPAILKRRFPKVAYSEIERDLAAAVARREGHSD